MCVCECVERWDVDSSEMVNRRSTVGLDGMESYRR